MKTFKELATKLQKTKYGFNVTLMALESILTIYSNVDLTETLVVESDYNIYFTDIKEIEDDLVTKALESELLKEFKK